jgi:hypothetical protein
MTYASARQLLIGTPAKQRDYLARTLSGENPDGTPFKLPVPTSKSASGLFMGGSPVGDNVQIARLAASDAVITQSTTRSIHRLVADTSTIRLVYGNVALNYSAGVPFEEGDYGAAFDVKAAVELSSGHIMPVFFQGRRQATIEQRALLVSDPVGVSAAAATDIWVRSRASGSAGVKWPYQRNVRSENGEGIENSVDKVDSGTITAVTAAGFVPLAIVTDADLPTVAMEGDSVIYGVGDTDIEPNVGFVRRALNRQFGYVGLSRSGARAEYLGTAGTFRVRMLMALGCRNAISNFGINDVGGTTGPAGVLGTRTAAQLEGDWLTIANMHARGGVNWYQCTLTPYSSSTDSWATTANQTNAATAARVTANDWLRDGCPIDATTKAAVATGSTGAVLRTKYISWNGSAFVTTGIRMPGHPIAGAFEIADLVESARNSGLWKVDGTAFKYVNNDTFGIHPSAFGHAAMAAGINTAEFR